MITLINYTGSSFTQGVINQITTKKTTKTPIIKMPGMDKDVIQKLGLCNREFTLKGAVMGSTGVSFLESALNNTGSFTFIMTSLGLTIYNGINVFYADLTWDDSGLKPMERGFSLRLVEII